jgi:Fic family protein
VFYTPPSHTIVPQLIESLCHFANEDDNVSEFLHPIIRGVIIHFLIGYIHTFVDGNGRTARALFYWYLLKRGYWLSEYLSISRVMQKSKTQYAKANLYSEYDNNNLTYFIRYHLKCISLAHKELLEYIAKKRKEKDELFDLTISGEYNERQVDILRKYLNDEKFYTDIKTYQNQFAISDQTARNDLYYLAKKTYLK